MTTQVSSHVVPVIDKALARDLLATYSSCGVDLHELETCVHEWNVQRDPREWVDADRTLVAFLAELATALTQAGNILADELSARPVILVQLPPLADVEDDLAADPDYQAFLARLAALEVE